MIRITDNDLKLFRYLFEEDFLTRNQIKDYVWNDLSNGYIDNRLADMIKQDFLIKKPDPTSRFKTILLAGQAAEQLIRNESIRKRMLDLNNNFVNSENVIKRYTRRKKIRLGQFEHDKKVTNVRFVLENAGAKAFVSERMIWRHNKNCDKNKKYVPIPDEIFTKDNITFALELENNLKKKFRYKDIFKKYIDENRIDKVLYICTSNAIYNQMIDYFTKNAFEFDIYSDEDYSIKERLAKNYNKFFVAMYDDIMQSNFKIYRKDKSVDLA